MATTGPESSLIGWEHNRLTIGPTAVASLAKEVAEHVPEPVARPEGAVPLVAGVLVDEPSTRTRWSTEAALARHGVAVVADRSLDGLSIAKGESLADTARALGTIVDVLFVRSRLTGLPLALARTCPVPVVNLGDGVGEHPTQALATLLHATWLFGDRSLRVLVAGDPFRSRCARSVAVLLLAHGSDVTVSASAPPPPWYERLGRRHGGRLRTAGALADLQGPYDLVYLTRRQDERDDDRPSGTGDGYAALAPLLAEDGALLHPLPRGPELPDAALDDPRVRVFPHQEWAVRTRSWVVERLVRGDPPWRYEAPAGPWPACGRSSCASSLVGHDPEAAGECSYCGRDATR